MLSRRILSRVPLHRPFSYDAKKSPFSKIMAANRGEIATRIMRAGTELGCTTVGIYSHEDRLQQHRYKADQAFQVHSNYYVFFFFLLLDLLYFMCYYLFICIGRSELASHLLVPIWILILLLTLPLPTEFRLFIR